MLQSPFRISPTNYRVKTPIVVWLAHTLSQLGSWCGGVVRRKFDARIREAQLQRDYGFPSTAQVAIAPAQIHVTLFAQDGVRLDLVEGIAEADFGVVGQGHIFRRTRRWSELPARWAVDGFRFHFVPFAGDGAFPSSRSPWCSATYLWQSSSQIIAPQLFMSTLIFFLFFVMVLLYHDSR